MLPRMLFDLMAELFLSESVLNKSSRLISAMDFETYLTLMTDGRRSRPTILPSWLKRLSEVMG